MASHVQQGVRRLMPERVAQQGARLFQQQNLILVVIPNAHGVGIFRWPFTLGQNPDGNTVIEKLKLFRYAFHLLALFAQSPDG